MKDRLDHLIELHAKGLLTDEEFAVARAELEDAKGQEAVGPTAAKGSDPTGDPVASNQESRKDGPSLGDWILGLAALGVILAGGWLFLGSQVSSGNIDECVEQVLDTYDRVGSGFIPLESAREETLSAMDGATRPARDVYEYFEVVAVTGGSAYLSNPDETTIRVVRNGCREAVG